MWWPVVRSVEQESRTYGQLATRSEQRVEGGDNSDGEPLRSSADPALALRHRSWIQSISRNLNALEVLKSPSLSERDVPYLRLSIFSINFFCVSHKY